MNFNYFTQMNLSSINAPQLPALFYTQRSSCWNSRHASVLAGPGGQTNLKPAQRKFSPSKAGYILFEAEASGIIFSRVLRIRRSDASQTQQSSTLTFPTAGLPRPSQLPHGRLLEETSLLRLLSPVLLLRCCFCNQISVRLLFGTSEAPHIPRPRSSFVPHSSLFITETCTAVLQYWQLILTTDYNPPKIDNQ